MKLIATITILTVCFWVGAAASLVSTINGHVRLGWGCAEPANTNLSFNIYCAPDLTTPATNWPLLTNILSTDALDTNDPSGTNYLVSLDLWPAQYFFVATSSNFWGQSSITSNVVATPPAPQPINTLKIQKLP